MKKMFWIVILMILLATAYWIISDRDVQSPESVSNKSEEVFKKEALKVPPIPQNNKTIDADLWRFYHEFKRLSALQPEPCTPIYSADEERLIREAVDLAISGEADAALVIDTLAYTSVDTYINWKEAVDEYVLRKYPQMSDTLNPAFKSLTMEEILQKVKAGEITAGLRTPDSELATRLYNHQITKAFIDDIKAAGIPLGAQFFDILLPSVFANEALHQQKKEVFMYAFADADLNTLRYDPIVLKDTTYLYRALAATGDTELMAFALDKGLPAFEKPYDTLADAVIEMYVYYGPTMAEPNSESQLRLTGEMLVKQLTWLAKRGHHPTNSLELKSVKKLLKKYSGKNPVFEAYINNLNQFEDVEKAKAELAEEVNFIKSRLRLHESDLKDFKKSVTQGDCKNKNNGFYRKRNRKFKKVAYELGQWIDNAYVSGKSSDDIEVYMSQTAGFLVGFKREWMLQKQEKNNPIVIHDDLKPILSQFFNINNAIEEGQFSRDDLNSRNFMYPLIAYYVFNKRQRENAPRHLRAIKAMGGDLNMMLQAMQYYSRLNHHVITRAVYDVLDEWGVDLSLPTVNGNNSFFEAIFNKDLALAKHLHSKGVPAISDPLLENPLEMAIRMPEVGTPEVIEYLRSLGLTNRVEDKQ